MGCGHPRSPDPVPVSVRMRKPRPPSYEASSAGRRSVAFGRVGTAPPSFSHEEICWSRVTSRPAVGWTGRASSPVNRRSASDQLASGPAPAAPASRRPVTAAAVPRARSRASSSFRCAAAATPAGAAGRPATTVRGRRQRVDERPARLGLSFGHPAVLERPRAFQAFARLRPFTQDPGQLLVPASLVSGCHPRPAPAGHTVQTGSRQHRTDASSDRGRRRPPRHANPRPGMLRRGRRPERHGPPRPPPSIRGCHSAARHVGAPLCATPRVWRRSRPRAHLQSAGASDDFPRMPARTMRPPTRCVMTPGHEVLGSPVDARRHGPGSLGSCHLPVGIPSRELPHSSTLTGQRMAPAVGFEPTTK